MYVIAGEISSFTRVAFVSENPCVAGSLPALTTLDVGRKRGVSSMFSAFFMEIGRE